MFPAAAPSSRAAQPPPQQARQADPGQPDAPPRTASAAGSAGSGARDWRELLSGGRPLQLTLLAGHIVICLTAVVSLVPLDRYLSHRAYFLCLRFSLLTLMYKVGLGACWAARPVREQTLAHQWLWQRLA